MRIRGLHKAALIALCLAFPFICTIPGRAHVVLLLEEPYGFFVKVIPVGHTAIYLEKVCAETPLKLRRCIPGEWGTVLTRNNGMGGYGWVAIPLIPYLYSVENLSEVPAKADRPTIWRLRRRYHEAHLKHALGGKIDVGNLFHGGWGLLIGMAYERRMYAFSFETTREQDDALIAKMNARQNHSRFDFLYNNCSDMARNVLNNYFPNAFPRNYYFDAGITTPKSVARRLVRVARRHSEMQLSVLQIPQIPGYRRNSRRSRGALEALVTTPAVVPIAIVSPIAAGGLFADYVLRGGFRLIPRNLPEVHPDNLAALTPLPAPPRISASDETTSTAIEISKPLEEVASAEPHRDMP